MLMLPELSTTRTYDAEPMFSVEDVGVQTSELVDGLYATEPLTAPVKAPDPTLGIVWLIVNVKIAPVKAVSG